MKNLFKLLLSLRIIGTLSNEDADDDGKEQ